MTAKQIYEAAEAAAHDIMEMYGGGTERGFGTSYGSTHLVLTQIIAKHFQAQGTARERLSELALELGAEGVFSTGDALTIRLKDSTPLSQPSAASG